MSDIIAVTGAAGGIGRALCATLAARGWGLHLIDRPACGLAAAAAVHSATFAEAEIAACETKLDVAFSAAAR